MISAPESWRSCLDWFYDWSESDRKEFAKKYCSKVYSYDGQSVVIISYPRKGSRVALYDMDAGRFEWVELAQCRVGDLFDKVYRDSEEADFQWSAITESALGSEAQDIAEQLFFE